MHFKTRLFLLLITLFSLTAFAQKTYVFFGSYNWKNTEKGLYVYTLDTLSGKLNKVSTLGNVLNPSYLTLSPGGGFVYSVTDSKTPNAGSVSSYKFDAEKSALSFINSQPSQGENPVYVSVHPGGEWLAEANYTQGGVTIYRVGADGTIGKPAQHFDYTEGSVNPKRQEKSHVHSAVFSPDGNFLFLPDLGSDKIRCYMFNQNAAKPLQGGPVPFIPTTRGSGPRHLAFHPNGKWAYCIEEIAGAVSVYKYANGTLQPLQRVFTHPEDVKNDDYEGSDVHVSPDGKFLYASNRGTQNNIAIYSIATDGQLTLLGYEPTRGEHPRTFAIDPSGKFIIVANVNSGTATVLKRDTKTGLLKYTGHKVSIKNVTTVEARVYN
ncbi:lactonase family protein [Flavobacterium sp. RHBU_24]|uniref:lactonase family protein n=1 Tax=Flavobacterium sp. RHBU_24 TaxID=3391185 RepID=UPI0039854417